MKSRSKPRKNQRVEWEKLTGTPTKLHKVSESAVKPMANFDLTSDESDIPLGQADKEVFGTPGSDGISTQEAMEALDSIEPPLALALPMAPPMPSIAASSSSSASAPLKLSPAILAAIEASVQKTMQDTIQKSVAESVAASTPLVAKAISQDLADGPVAEAIAASESRLSSQIEGVDKKARKEERKLSERITAHEREAAKRFEAMDRKLASQTGVVGWPSVFPLLKRRLLP